MRARRFVLGLAAAAFSLAPAAGPQMPPQPGKLIIDSDPTNAPITVNGKKLSQRTRVTLIVSPGTYSVAVGEKGGNPNCSASTATVVSGQTATWICSGNHWTQVPKN